MNQAILNGILLQSFLILLGLGAIVGILVGTGMLLRHEQVTRLNQQVSRWMRTDNFGEQLDRPRWTERFLYRHHRLVGSVLFIGAIIVLYTFLFSYNLRRISAAIKPDYWWLLDALVGMLLIGSVLAAVIGFIMLTKPSLLRDVENAANRWISTDYLQKYLDGRRDSVDHSILAHRKLAGVGLIFGSLYVLGSLGYFFFKGAGKF